MAEKDEKPVEVLKTDAEVMDVVKNPAKYGFEWAADWDVAAVKDKDGQYFAGGKALVMREKFPVIPKVIDGPKFAKAFGWAALVDAYNGTSGRVDAQGDVRAMFVAAWYVDKGKSITVDMARAVVVRRVLFGEKGKGSGGGGQWYVDAKGNKFRTLEEVMNANKAHAERDRTFKGMDGVEYKTALEAKQASVAFMVASGLTHEQAAALVVNMPDA